MNHLFRQNSWKRQVAVLGVLGIVATWPLGCGGTSPPPPPASPGAGPVTPSPQPPVRQEPPEPVQIPETPPATPVAVTPTIPQVLLSESMRKSCVVWIGDLLPGARLVDLDGQPRTIRESLGPRLTVVLFWSAGQSRLARLAAQNLLTDLQEEIAKPFASDGLQVLAIHVGNDDPALKKLVADAGITFPVLVDRNRAYFALVAREYLPRIYLLDSQGKILWLDLAFSELSGTTRENLLQAVQAALALTPPLPSNQG